jgi:hypothetical protein
MSTLETSQSGKLGDEQLQPIGLLQHGTQVLLESNAAQIRQILLQIAFVEKEGILKASPDHRLITCTLAPLSYPITNEDDAASIPDLECTLRKEGYRVHPYSSVGERLWEGLMEIRGGFVAGKTASKGRLTFNHGMGMDASIGNRDEDRQQSVIGIIHREVPMVFAHHHDQHFSAITTATSTSRSAVPTIPILTMLQVMHWQWRCWREVKARL